MYDSSLRRFYGVDPLHEFASPYCYVGNNPLSFIDPTGMEFVGYFPAPNSDDSKLYPWHEVSGISVRANADGYNNGLIEGIFIYSPRRPRDTTSSMGIVRRDSRSPSGGGGGPHIRMVGGNNHSGFAPGVLNDRLYGSIQEDRDEFVENVVNGAHEINMEIMRHAPSIGVTVGAGVITGSISINGASAQLAPNLLTATVDFNLINGSGRSFTFRWLGGSLTVGSTIGVSIGPSLGSPFSYTDGNTSRSYNWWKN